MLIIILAVWLVPFIVATWVVRKHVDADDYDGEGIITFLFYSLIPVFNYFIAFAVLVICYELEFKFDKILRKFYKIEKPNEGEEAPN